MLHQFMPTKQVDAKSNYVLAPMPGLLVSLLVKPDQIVRSGDQLAVIEAMKMETDIRADKSGKVSTINVGNGDSVKVGDVLLTLS